jgi:hypothetical protein
MAENFCKESTSLPKSEGFTASKALFHGKPARCGAACSTFYRSDSSTQASTVFPPKRIGGILPLKKWTMKTWMKIRPRFSIATGLACMAPVWVALAWTALLAGAPLATAQTPARFVGTITALGGNTLTVKTDQGQAYPVEVPAAASLKRIAPGQRDLSTAQTIQFSDLAVGDRALVRLDPDAPAGVSQALQIVAIKQTDVARKQQMEREDWQRRGVGGLVRSVDAASGTIVLTAGAGAAAKTITVHTSSATMLKRYASASVRFDAALPAPIEAIHAGDQLRARGTKSADGTEIAAEEVVSGSFRNISGTIASLDASTSMLVVKDLATKKPVTVHITAEAQMRLLPDRVAQILAVRLKETAGNGPGGQRTGQGAADPQQMISRAPAIPFADLKKGEAVILVTTEGTTDVTAITLLAGVEPLLESPAAGQDLLSNWSMNTGAGAAEAAQ